MSGTFNTEIDPGQPVIYQIRLKGHLGRHWTDWFDGLTITLEDNGETLLTGPVVKSNVDARRAWLAANRLPLSAGQRARAEASEDAFDAAVAACRAAAVWTEPAWRAEPADPVVELEGWIWGVPLPGR